jgi:hypothetical protein
MPCLAELIMPTIKVRKQATLLQLKTERADHEARARKHCVTRGVRVRHIAGATRSVAEGDWSGLRELCQ